MFLTPKLTATASCVAHAAGLSKMPTSAPLPPAHLTPPPAANNPMPCIGPGGQIKWTAYRTRRRGAATSMLISFHAPLDHPSVALLSGLQRGPGALGGPESTLPHRAVALAHFLIGRHRNGHSWHGF